MQIIALELYSNISAHERGKMSNDDQIYSLIYALQSHFPAKIIKKIK